VKRAIFSLFVFALVGVGQNDVPSAPLSIAVVPTNCYGENCFIQTGHKTPATAKPEDFYIVLTNISQQNQPVYEYWNGWGCQTISFVLTTEDGKKYVMSRRPKQFDYNFPSTFLIKPGQQQVFAIRFDDDWEMSPMLPQKDETQVTLRAIYEVSAKNSTPDDFIFPPIIKERVWKGRIESPSYANTTIQSRYAVGGNAR
jgi:hypothetical protein